MTEGEVGNVEIPETFSEGVTEWRLRTYPCVWKSIIPYMDAIHSGLKGMSLSNLISLEPLVYI